MSREREFGVAEAAELISACDTGERVVPNQTNFRDSYWLWDSGYVAAGLAYVDPGRAKRELLNLMVSQYSNGMVPHMVLRDDQRFARAKHFLAWGTKQTEQPVGMMTSGITQPPVIATTTRVVAEQVSDQSEKQEFLRAMYGGLVDYHQWFLRERDPSHDGVITIIHPWESGMDNSPSIVAAIKPGRVAKLAGQAIDRLRYDVKEGLDSELRTTSAHGVAMAGLVYKLRKKDYAAARIVEEDQPAYAVDSVLVNHVLLKATKDLRWIAEQLGHELPADLASYLGASRDIVSEFWNECSQRFYDVDAWNDAHIFIPTISNILPIINHEDLSPEQRDKIVGLMTDDSEFDAPFLAPTISKSSDSFHPEGYWSGPMWPWINRYLFHGAREAGELEIASKLRQAVVGAVGAHGAFEHYSPLDGTPGGAKGFSPTAATYVELDSSEVK